jgi:acetylxylan esterase
MLRLRSLKSRLLAAALALGVAAGLSLQAIPQAQAASLTQISNFGNNPSGLQMYLYVPNNAKPNPPVLLALHGCQGSGPYLYSSTDFGKLADQYGFIVIYPSTNPAGSCWDVSSTQALTRNGGSDPVGLMSMITYTEQHYGANPNALYVTGESSGGMMTNVMAADYPDIFKAAAAYMGVPYYCFYTGTVKGWNGPCGSGQETKTAQQWGDLVRNTAYPGYNGPRPRMQLWHGTADTTVGYANLAEEIKQWTNVLGVSQTPTSSDTPAANWNRTRYNDTTGKTQVEAYSIVGAGHQLPIQGTQMAAYAIHFMGLDGTTTTGNTITITNPGNQTATAGTAINTLQIHATDSATGQTLTYSATGLPPGLTITSTGAISGTPSSGGSFTTTVTATDTTGATGSATFSWSVSGASTGGGTCQVSYVKNEWGGGFTANLTVTNAGTAAINGWTLAWSFPGDQKVTSGWNATVTQTGSAASATNLSYNAAIAPGGNVQFGFQGTWTSNDTNPAAFTLNGTACG